ncbi:wax ester/triacylglycerol synthase domain-containing protein [Smaragdicoccus niigatensis]
MVTAGVIVIEMSEAQLLWWRAGASSTVTIVMVLDDGPSWERVWAAHEWALTVAPRLSERVVESKLTTAVPVWSAAGTFRLADHLTRTTVEGGLPELLALAQSISTFPIDVSKPLWEATLVEGCNAYILRFHRALMESVGGLALLERLMSGRPTGRNGGLPARRREYLPSLLDNLIEQTRRLPLDVTTLLRSSIRTSVETSLRIAIHPRRTAGESLRYVGSIIGLSTVRRSPLWTARRGIRPRLGVVSCSASALARAAATAGGTIEDAYLAAVLGGIDQYHQRYWVTLESLPVSIRGEVRDAPIGLQNPAERIAALADGSSSSRGPADLISTVVGELTTPAFIAGARVKELFAFQALDSAALTTTLAIQGDTCCVAVTCDGDAVSQPALLVECLQNGFDEVLALGVRGQSAN